MIAPTPYPLDPQTLIWLLAMGAKILDIITTPNPPPPDTPMPIF